MIRCLVFSSLVSLALCCSPVAGADPLSGEAATPDGQTTPVKDACARFGAALHLAASSYDEFAYATAGNGDLINYADQNVWRTNLIGRTALREAAHEALSAARTPGLPAEVSEGIRAWSLDAAKLMLVMGLRGGGDTLNQKAAELNNEAQNAQMACATNGGQA